jgi:hypothetical protein
MPATNLHQKQAAMSGCYIHMPLQDILRIQS